MQSEEEVIIIPNFYFSYLEDDATTSSDKNGDKEGQDDTFIIGQEPPHVETLVVNNNNRRKQKLIARNTECFELEIVQKPMPCHTHTSSGKRGNRNLKKIPGSRFKEALHVNILHHSSSSSVLTRQDVRWERPELSNFTNNNNKLTTTTKCKSILPDHPQPEIFLQKQKQDAKPKRLQKATKYQDNNSAVSNYFTATTSIGRYDCPRCNKSFFNEERLMIHKPRCFVKDLYTK